ncbi:adenylate kinase family protein [Patescibacteria group bacterium]
MKILLMGAPASGKGTVGKKLSEYLKLPLVSVGQQLRNVPKESVWYEMIHKEMDKGNLVPNDIIGRLLEEAISEEKYQNGYILDGWGRRMSDLEQFDPKPDAVIHITICEETAIERTKKRAELESRKDDSLDILKTRFELYKTLTVPVVDMYENQGILLEIDGEGTKDEVFELVKESLLTFTQK